MKGRLFNILLADDDPTDLILISAILQGMGHTIEAVTDGREAIKLFSAKPGYFEVLITDHQMPVVSGLELVQYLRQNEFGGKIVVLSGVPTEELTIAYGDKRVDKILQKTFRLDELSSILSATFDQWSE